VDEGTAAGPGVMTCVPVCALTTPGQKIIAANAAVR